MKKIITLIGLTLVLASCGGGGGGGSATVASGGNTSGGTTQITSAPAHCAVPRPASTIDPDTNAPYGDVQGTLSDEMAWIASFVNQTYLWYADVPVVSSTPYVIGATVPYVDPSDNSAGTKTLMSNYDVVDAYFNSQRSPLFTASGKPKDQFHFTYVTTDWQNLSAQGTEAGFGFDVALLAAAPPREALIAYVSPGSPADLAGLVRGTVFVSVNGVSVANGSDVNTLNEGLFSPTVNTSYTFVVQLPGSSTQTTVNLTAQNIVLTPVMNVQTITGYPSIGYIQFNDHIATAESELVAAINQLNAANGGTGITDLVLDMRYNGGGYLDLASELAYMIAGPAATNGKIFELDAYNNKNPFDLTTAQATTPFLSTAQGLSTTAGTPLPYLGLPTVYVITTGGTCSASEAVINGLVGAGINVIQIGTTTCGKPYGFYPQDNCSTTYFTIQFDGVNNLGFGAYADGFTPSGTSAFGSTQNILPGCPANDDFSNPLGNPAEASLATALYYKTNGVCPNPEISLAGKPQAKAVLGRSPARENRIMRRHLVAE